MYLKAFRFATTIVVAVNRAIHLESEESTSTIIMSIAVLLLSASESLQLPLEERSTSLPAENKFL